MSSEYEIAFYGKLVDGISYEEVRSQLISASSMDEARADAILSSFSVVVLERGLQEEEARYFAQKMQELGLIVEAEPTVESAFCQNRPYLGPVVPDAVRTQSASDKPCAPIAKPTLAERDLPFEFTGRGGEYFKIWIVNVLLSIVTLGIYSAWAKVRTMRYFYGNTKLDGSSFEYLADPIKVLKGRLIVAAFLTFSSIAGQSSAVVSFICFIALLFFTPWVIANSLRFRARYSAWRGVRFSFVGTMGGAGDAYLGWHFLAVITLGLYVPQFFRQKIRYVVNNMRFGGVAFVNSASTWAFYSIFLKLIGIVILAWISVYITYTYFFEYIFRSAYAFGVAWSMVVLHFLEFVIVLSCFFAFLCIAPLLLNLRYGCTVLGGHVFHSNYRVNSYFWLVFKNTLGIILTAGLFYPFAKVRMARYKADHLYVTVLGDLDEFVAEQEKKVSATGSEVGDLFDFDTGF